mgnify:CR=1 FL=1
MLSYIAFARAELANPSCSYFSLRCMIAGFVASRGPQECFSERHGVLHRAHRDKDPDKKCTHRGCPNNVNKNKSANKESRLRNRLT